MKCFKRKFLLVILVFVLCMCVSMGISLAHSRGIIRENYENDSRVVAALVCNGIENEFLRPITVAETISKDSITKSLLMQKDRQAAMRVEGKASEYLESLRDGFGYSMVFAVSDYAKAFYNCDGILKYIDPEHDPSDVWYQEFRDSEKLYNVKVDKEEEANWDLSIFVNYAVYNTQNHFLGVCGVGMELTQLKSMLERYERIYEVKIDLIDEAGMIQMDTDISRIQTDFIEIDNLEEYSDGEVYYEMLSEGSRVITYMEDLDWYLVVQNENRMQEEINQIAVSHILCLAAGILILALVMRYGDHNEAEK